MGKNKHQLSEMEAGQGKATHVSLSPWWLKVSILERVNGRGEGSKEMVLGIGVQRPVYAPRSIFKDEERNVHELTK